MNKQHMREESIFLSLTLTDRAKRSELIKLVNYLCQFVSYEDFKSINEKVNVMIRTDSLQIDFSKSEVEKLITFFIEPIGFSNQ
jgi:hypothetical protein